MEGKVDWFVMNNPLAQKRAMTITRSEFLAQQQQKNYDEVVLWTEKVLHLDSKVNEDMLAEGTFLCKLFLAVTDKKLKSFVPNPSEPFRRIENINSLLEGYKECGVKVSFNPTDLLEKKNIPKVITVVHEFGTLVSKKGFKPSIDSVYEEMVANEDEDRFKEMIIQSEKAKEVLLQSKKEKQISVLEAVSILKSELKPEVVSDSKANEKEKDVVAESKANEKEKDVVAESKANEKEKDVVAEPKATEKEEDVQPISEGPLKSDDGQSSEPSNLENEPTDPTTEGNSPSATEEKVEVGSKDNEEETSESSKPEIILAPEDEKPVQSTPVANNIVIHIKREELTISPTDFMRIKSENSILAAEKDKFSKKLEKKKIENIELQKKIEILLEENETLKQQKVQIPPPEDKAPETKVNEPQNDILIEENKHLKTKVEDLEAQLFTISSKFMSLREQVVAQANEITTLKAQIGGSPTKVVEDLKKDKKVNLKKRGSFFSKKHEPKENKQVTVKTVSAVKSVVSSVKVVGVSDWNRSNVMDPKADSTVGQLKRAFGNTPNTSGSCFPVKSVHEFSYAFGDPEHDDWNSSGDAISTNNIEEVLVIGYTGFSLVKAYTEEVIWLVPWRSIKCWAVGKTGNTFRADFLDTTTADGKYIFLVRILRTDQPEDILNTILEWVEKKKVEITTPKDEDSPSTEKKKGRGRTLLANKKK